MPDQSVLVDALFAEYTVDGSPGAAVLVVQDGEMAHSKGYGQANLEHAIPITPETVFDIASVSKQFAAFSIILLAQDGRLSLDEPMQTYLPEMPDFGHQVTIRHLVHHVSGLRDWVVGLAIAGWRMDDVISFDHILNMARHQRELNFVPGDEYLYSNTGYGMLAETVARVTGQSFREWTQAHIFEPLGMHDTHFHDDHTMVVPNRADSYTPDGDGGFRHAVSNLMALGSSSLFTTITDMAKWALNFEHAQVGGTAAIERMLERMALNSGEPHAYAFGLTHGEHRGLASLEHGGSWAGYRSHYLYFPEHRTTVVILANLSTFQPSRLARQIADIYLADHVAPAEPAAQSAAAETTGPPEPDPSWRPLADFVGLYHSEEFDAAYRCIVQGDQLIVQHRRHADMVLTRTGEATFQSSVWFFHQVQFTVGSDGQVVGFRLTSGRVRHVRFDRIGITRA